MLHEQESKLLQSAVEEDDHRLCH